jgi:hypothetical protein
MIRFTENEMMEADDESCLHWETIILYEHCTGTCRICDQRMDCWII